MQKSWDGQTHCSFRTDEQIFNKFLIVYFCSKDVVKLLVKVGCETIFDGRHNKIADFFQNSFNVDIKSKGLPKIMKWLIVVVGVFSF